jgi:hypothetical protein
MNSKREILLALFIVFFFIAKAPDLFAESYVIHISSYQEENKAIVDQERLKKKELPAFIKMAKINNKRTWFRVLIGPYSDYNNAVNTAKALTRKKLASYAKVIPYCGFQYLSKDKRSYVAQCIGGIFDGSVFKIKRGIVKIFYAVPEISPIFREAEGETFEEVGDKACGCQ